MTPATPLAARSWGSAARALRWLVAGLALGAILVAWWQLERAGEGLVVRTQLAGSTPVTVFRPAASVPADTPQPVVLIAHGFAGSQQLMQPFAYTLARNGFVAVTFDFPGHGRNGVPMRGGLADHEESLRVLLAAMDEMGRFAQGLAGGGQARYAVVGHSMASDIVVRHAQSHAAVQATVGVSMFAPTIQTGSAPDSPRNLLAVAGALEPGMMAREALRVVGRGTGADPALANTYGRFEDGSARRAVLAPGVEHIGVLYSVATQAETLAWLNRAFGRPTAATPYIDARGPWLGVLLAGLVGLAWPLSSLLPRAMPRHTGAGRLVASRRWWGRRGQLPVTVLPALLTPLLLWPLPTAFLPILLGDYLMLHFGLYGLLTWVGLRLLRDPAPPVAPGRSAILLLAMVAAAAYAVLAVGAAVNAYAFNVQPIGVRVPLIAALCAGTLPYFLADERLTRSPAAPRGAYIASKACFLVSLVLAIALDPGRLFFLAIIVPAILLLFLVYGLFSRWAMRASGHPGVGGTANALAFGCFVAAAFPLVA